jgi:hypothetical protein
VRRSERGAGPALALASMLLPLSFARILALPAARLTATIAASVLAVSLIAGGVRVLPLLLSPGVPLRLAPVLARGVIGVSLETALFVAPPIAWALAAARLVERGEARALFALGVRPLGLIASTWPAALVVAIAAGLAAASWGREAAAPGRLVRDLLAEARDACRSAIAPSAVDVPLIEISWVCLPGEPPRAVGAALRGGPPEGPGARGKTSGGDGAAQMTPAFAARSLSVSDDLRSIDAADLELVFPPRPSAAPEAASASRPPLSTAGAARLRVAKATIHGLAPIGRASNLSVASRALLLGAAAIGLSAAAAARVLAFAIRSRARALAIGAAGPAAALMAFSSLERGPAPAIAYAALPLAGLAALTAVGWLVGRHASVT